ncbi:MAG: hypothetical protein JWO81_3297 [Alphaproteobacteria bacterium]|nr:hypothetical protein [Alphaproteobacteria bacterium]
MSMILYGPNLRRPRGGCRDGQHRPTPKAQEDADGRLRKSCRDCGATLVPGLGRAWIFSGELG